MTGFVLAAPVVSGNVSPPDPHAQGDLVVMGLDGRPTSATFASAAATLTMDADGTVRVERTASRAERSSLPVQLPAPAPTPEPPPVVAPAPSAAAPAPKGTATAPARPAPATSAAPRTALPAAPAPAPTSVPAESTRGAEVLVLVNRARESAGCPPLTADPGLAAVAAAHSTDMRDRGFFDHVDPEGLSPFDRASAAGVSARAENIARGQADAAAVMDSWMSSPGHRANILDCGLTRHGVGIADGADGPWWTQLFV